MPNLTYTYIACPLRVMIIFSVILYFTMVSFITWLVFVPESRVRCLYYVRITASKASQLLSWPFNQIKTINSNNFRTEFHFSCLSHRKYIIAAAFLLLLPVSAAVVFRNHIQLEGFTENAAGKNPVIAALLEGEQLVPPAPMPPEIFATVEIQAERPMISSASRDWQLLQSDFRQRLLHAYKIMAEKHGYTMVLIEGYRTPERQNSLAAIGSHVTSARAYQSYHQHGLAADSAFLNDGKIVISEKNPWAMRGYQLFGEVAESVGLTWGGNWRMMDLGHVELRNR